jgi:hypothetical protein
MIKALKILDPENLKTITNHLEKHKDKFTLDKSNYAQNRKKFWLEWEWDLLNRKFIPAIKDPKLWNLCKLWYPEANLGLVTHGDVGIELHRDDSYAAFKAVGANLGELDHWIYDCQYPNYHYTKKINPSNPKKYNMPPGLIFQFNCKNPHAAVGPVSDRWAIFLWQINHKLKEQFKKETIKFSDQSSSLHTVDS